MKRILLFAVPAALFACKKPVNTLDNPEYKLMVAHSWVSDSVSTRRGGIMTVAYASAENYGTLEFDFPHCEFDSYVNGTIKDSAKNSFGYQQGVITLFPEANGESVFTDYANIEAVTENRLVLERHTSADSSVPVVTTYYHAQ